MELELRIYISSFLSSFDIREVWEVFVKVKPLSPCWIFEVSCYQFFKSCTYRNRVYTRIKKKIYIFNPLPQTHTLREILRRNRRLIEYPNLNRGESTRLFRKRLLCLWNLFSQKQKKIRTPFDIYLIQLKWINNFFRCDLIWFDWRTFEQLYQYTIHTTSHSHTHSIGRRSDKFNSTRGIFYTIQIQRVYLFSSVCTLITRNICYYTRDKIVVRGAYTTVFLLYSFWYSFFFSFWIFIFMCDKTSSLMCDWSGFTFELISLS